MTRCPRCGSKPDHSFADYASWWVVTCDGCYDGAHDSGVAHEVGRGATIEEAILDWVEKVER